MRQRWGPLSGSTSEALTLGHSRLAVPDPLTCSRFAFRDVFVRFALDQDDLSAQACRPSGAGAVPGHLGGERPHCWCTHVGVRNSVWGWGGADFFLSSNCQRLTLVGWLVGRSVGRLVGWLLGWAAASPASRLLCVRGWLVGWLAGWLAGFIGVSSWSDLPLVFGLVAAESCSGLVSGEFWAC